MGSISTGGNYPSGMNRTFLFSFFFLPFSIFRNNIVSDVSSFVSRRSTVRILLVSNFYLLEKKNVDSQLCVSDPPTPPNLVVGKLSSARNKLEFFPALLAMQLCLKL